MTERTQTQTPVCNIGPLYSDLESSLCNQVVYEEFQISNQQVIDEQSQAVQRLRRHLVIVGILVSIVSIGLILTAGVLSYYIVTTQRFIQGPQLSAVNTAFSEGSWSSWSIWETCSATCGVGMTNRRRRCNYTLPLRFGLPCEGDSTESRICNQEECSGGEVIEFFAMGVNYTTPAEISNLIFELIQFNIGTCFNKNTGEFIVPVQGLYWFKANICFEEGKQTAICIDEENAWCALSYDADHGGCATNTLVLRLKPGARVSVRILSANPKIATPELFYFNNYFRGALVKYSK